MESFNVKYENSIDFEVFAGIKATINGFSVSESGMGTSCSILFPNDFPEGLAGVSITSSLGIDWDGEITELSAGIDALNMKFAGFTADVTELKVDKNGATIKSLKLTLPANMNGTSIAIVNAGFDTVGNFYGDVEVPFISVDIAGFTLNLEEPDIDFDEQEISFTKAALQAPELVGAWEMAINGVSVGASSGLQFSGGAFRIPDFVLAGGMGFQDVFIDFSINGQNYDIAGGGKVMVPGLGTIGAEVAFTNINDTYPIGLKRAYFSYTAWGFGLPLGTTGIYLNGIRGGVAFGPADEVPAAVRGAFGVGMRLSLGLTLVGAGGPDVIVGDMDVWVDVYDWDWAFQGEIAVLNRYGQRKCACLSCGGEFLHRIRNTVNICKGECQPLYI